MFGAVAAARTAPCTARTRCQPCVRKHSIWDHPRGQGHGACNPFVDVCTTTRATPPVPHISETAAEIDAFAGQVAPFKGLLCGRQLQLTNLHILGECHWWVLSFVSLGLRAFKGMCVRSQVQLPRVICSLLGSPHGCCSECSPFSSCLAVVCKVPPSQQGWVSLA